MALPHRNPLCSRYSFMAVNLQMCLFICSNICTGMIVFLGFYCSTQLSNTVVTDKVGRQLLGDLHQTENPLVTLAGQMQTTSPSALNSPIVSSTVVYHFFSKMDLPYLASDHHSNMLCRTRPQEAGTSSAPPSSKASNSKTAASSKLTPSLAPPTIAAKASDAGSLKRVSREALLETRSSNHSSASNQTSLNHTHLSHHTFSVKPGPSSNVSSSGTPSSKLSHVPSAQPGHTPSAPPSKPPTPARVKTVPIVNSPATLSSVKTTPSLATPAPAKAIVSDGSLRATEGPTAYIPYVIGITPTYYRMTQRLDMISLCQTLMNVPRFLWIVVEDANSTSSQVRDILSHCRVESVLLHVKTTPETKKAKQRGVEQRNLAMDWIRDRCKECDGRGTCEGVVYFMDDDNTFDIRLFEKIRWTKGVSVFPVGFVAGLKFEGPVCKDGKVERWQVQYAPKRHIPVDMAAFAVNVHMLTSKPKVRMGFKPDGVKRSVPGYLEPDFLKSLGASRSTVECRGASDEILVWHVKSTYKSLVYEKKHPSDPKVKV